MVSKRHSEQALSAPDSDPYYDDYEDAGFPARRTPPHEEEPVPRRWRQWYASSLEMEGAPLEVQAPRKRQWGRLVYLSLVIGAILFGVDVVAGHVLWYNATGSFGGRQYQLSPTDVSTVKDIAVQPGQHVSKGQTLVRLSSPQLSQNLAQARTNIAELESKLQATASSAHAQAATLRAQISGLQAQYQALHQQYQSRQQQINTMESLAAKGALNFGDVRALQQKQSQLQAQSSSVYAQIQSDRVQLRQLDAQGKGSQNARLQHRLASLKQLRKSLDQRMSALSLKSPINGIVAQVSVTQGQTVKPGQAAVVVVPSGHQRTLLYFPPAARSHLHRGKTLSVTLPDGSHAAMRIAHVYPSVQALPADLQSRVNHSGPVIVVVARPVSSHAVTDVASGTPVTARVSRWQTGRWVTTWWHEARSWL